MDGRIARLTPLVNQLQGFCRGHEDGDCGVAAAEMLACLRQVWPDIPDVALPSVPDDDRQAEQLALAVVHDVGEMAGILLTKNDPDEELAWSRANLILDLERYRVLTQTPD